MKSKILVFLQFFIIFLLFITLSSGIVYFWSALIIFTIGVIIGIKAIRTHKEGNFNIRPDIKEECELVTDGIYAYIRHPMYLSVIVMMFGVMLATLSLYGVLLYILLLIVMSVKLTYEESLWCHHTKEYEEYKKKTKRLIPFLF
jgi:protein-S-isoprenylcysteine O-methyltransferase Ste14